MKQILKHILILAFAAGFIGTACENNDLNIDAGTFPETGGIGLSMGILQSDNYAMENPQINMDHASLSDQFRHQLNRTGFTNRKLYRKSRRIQSTGLQFEARNELPSVSYRIHRFR